jgi:hypothetical protein
LHVLSCTGRTNKRREALWRCQCDCGNPEIIEVSSMVLVRRRKKSCGCIRGRKAKVDHNNRDCCEAVLLALHCAARWKKELWVHFSHFKTHYVIFPERNRNYPVAYRVTSQGQVTHSRGYPDYATLFGHKTERIYIQFRMVGFDPPDPWTTYKNDHVFFAHQRHLAEECVRRLNEEHAGHREHRILED